jgi:hypothetical protein
LLCNDLIPANPFICESTQTYISCNFKPVHCQNWSHNIGSQSQLYNIHYCSHNTDGFNLTLKFFDPITCKL